MVYPPGQGKSGEYLMDLWRRYLEQLAGKDGDPASQIVTASYHAAELLGFLSLSLDRNRKYRSLILERIECFHKFSAKAGSFEDCLVNASFAIYNHMNTLCHQFTGGNTSAAELVRSVDEQVRTVVQRASQVERATAALRAAFPLLSMMALVLVQGTPATAAIRKVEERFAAGSGRSASDRDHLLNALYRLVEMMQLLVGLSDPELKDQVQQIADVFKEEDQTSDHLSKIRNGFCRLFELSHLLATHLDEVL